MRWVYTQARDFYRWLTSCNGLTANPSCRVNRHVEARRGILYRSSRTLHEA
jgi:hypothetical protein